MKSLFDFLRTGALKEQIQSLTQVFFCLGDGSPLAGNVHLGAEGDIPIAMASLDDCSKILHFVTFSWVLMASSLLT